MIGWINQYVFVFLKTAYCSLAMLIDYNHEHNILRIFNTLPNETKWSEWNKAWLLVTHCIYELPHELPNDSRLRILGN